jgi:hypothetical protein
MILTDGEISFFLKQLKEMQWDVKIAKSKKKKLTYHIFNVHDALITS